MKHPHNFKPKQPVVWFNNDLKKSNRHCLYCSIDLHMDGVESNKEHLIGREFVPKGSFGDGQCFNFIFRACKDCNDQKGVYDRHISSISFAGEPSEEHDPKYHDSILGKIHRDYHPDKQGTLIKDSHEHQGIKARVTDFGDVKINLASPPQMNRDYAIRLAYHHIQGLFSLTTSADPTTTEGTRLLPPEHFKAFEIYNYLDWGNPRLLELTKRTKSWPMYVNINTADGYFKAIMRRDDENDTGWFWALEWNKSFRYIGFISSEEKVKLISKYLPKLTWINMGANRIREEVRLSPEDDDLFEE